MEFFAKIANVWKPLIIFAKSSILDIRLGFEYASNLHIYSIIIYGNN